MAKNKVIWLNKEIEADFTVLGFDCSSSTIGWGFIGNLNNEPKLLAHGYIKPLKSDQFLFKRLDDVYSQITTLCNVLKPTYVAIEDIFIFMKGASTAKTITILTAFNRTAGLAAYQTIGNLFLYSVHEIRKLIKNNYNDIKNTIKKEELPDIIRKHLEPKFTDTINKKGNIDKKTYDESDAIAVAWACYLFLRDNNERSI